MFNVHEIEKGGGRGDVMMSGGERKSFSMSGRHSIAQKGFCIYALPQGEMNKIEKTVTQEKKERQFHRG